MTVLEQMTNEAHRILHEFTGRPCRTDGGWCDARDHAEVIARNLLTIVMVRQVKNEAHR